MSESEAKEHGTARQSAASEGTRSQGKTPAVRSLPDSRLHKPYCKCRRCDVEF